jgi:copper chaperone NosL
MRADLKSRLLMVLAALLLLPAFITPLWSIGLVAPQYPDGLGMHIYVHDVQGHERHDLQNINILNHYIGMQPIEPENIPELDIMPWVLGGLIVTGLLVAALGWPKVMAGWLVLVVAAGVAGMVDFYLWNIDYGHNLSPDAPIKIPDMTYSPPIIGTAQLLNIRASSWPGLGTLFIAVSVLLSGWAVFRALRRGNGSETGPAGAGVARAAGSDHAARADTLQARAGLTSTTLMLAVLAVGVSGCEEPGVDARPAVVPPPLAEGDRMSFEGSEDPFCGGPVQEIRWGGELERTDGEVLRFQSAFCLAGHLVSGATPPEEVRRIRVVDFPQGHKLVPAEDARFLLTPNLRAPAGPNVMAIETEKMAINLQAAYAGRIMDWEGVLDLARERAAAAGAAEEGP